MTAVVSAAIVFAAPLAHTAPLLLREGPGCHDSASGQGVRTEARTAAAPRASGTKAPCHGAPEAVAVSEPTAAARAGRRLPCHGVSAATGTRPCCAGPRAAIKARHCGCGHDHEIATLLVDPGVPERDAGVALMLPEAGAMSGVCPDDARCAEPPDSPPPVRL